MKKILVIILITMSFVGYSQNTNIDSTITMIEMQNQIGEINLHLDYQNKMGVKSKACRTFGIIMSGVGMSLYNERPDIGSVLIVFGSATFIISDYMISDALRKIRKR